ncbi:aminoglycoside phosphotransferase/kinase family protein [Flindersiella endophytica]
MDTQLDRALDVVHELNQTHDLRFSLRERCQGGLNGGAWLLADPAGEQAILKWRTHGGTNRIAGQPRLVERIRAAGYPTPAWLAAGITSAGVVYHVQEYVPGEPMTTMTGRTAAQLVEVVERQAGLDPDPGHNWSPYVTRCAREEGPDDPRRVVRGLGTPGAELLDHFDAVLTGYGDIALPAGDLVHGDFNTCNVLAHDGEITGVIDLEAFGSGTRAVDYAWLLREAHVRGAEPEAIAMIRRAGEAVAGPGVLAVCAAATAFDITLFQHHHDPRSVPWTLEGLHRLADDLAS